MEPDVANVGRRRPDHARAEDYKRAPTPHWHQLGRRWRPLHEQLDALRDAIVWAGARGPLGTERGRQPGAVEYADEVSLGCVQHGSEYAALAVAGPVTGRAAYCLRAQLSSVLDAGVSIVVIDLSEVTTAGVGLCAVLDGAWRRIRIRHGELILLNAASSIQSLLDAGPLRDRMMYCGTSPLVEAPGRARPSRGAPDAAKNKGGCPVSSR
jgi:ABC-type transporter Mla MlaB component